MACTPAFLPGEYQPGIECRLSAYQGAIFAMISRNDLLILLDEAIQTEELLIGIYSGDCMSLVEKVVSNPNKIDHFTKFFRSLGNESRRHRQSLENLRSAVRIDHDRRHF